MLVIQSIQTGLDLLKASTTSIQYMITGAVLLGAVVIDSVSRKTPEGRGSRLTARRGRGRVRRAGRSGLVAQCPAPLRVVPGTVRTVLGYSVPGIRPYVGRVVGTSAYMVDAGVT